MKGRIVGKQLTWPGEIENVMLCDRNIREQRKGETNKKREGRARNRSREFKSGR